MKYENVYLHAYRDGREAREGLEAYFEFYNARRIHQALDYRTPDEVYFATRAAGGAPAAPTVMLLPPSASDPLWARALERRSRAIRGAVHPLIDRLANRIDCSPRQVAQRQNFAGIFGPAHYPLGGSPRARSAQASKSSQVLQGVFSDGFFVIIGSEQAPKAKIVLHWMETHRIDKAEFLRMHPNR